jgi:polyhydroxyalkanoate synthesis regulator phasin
MNPDNLTEVLQKGFRVTLGATTALVESLQDPLKRDENLSKMQTDFAQLTEEWAEKGAVTELEARRMVDELWQQQSSSPPPAASSTPDPAGTQRAGDSQLYQDVQELTAQIAALRAELEQLQKSDPHT